MKKKIMLSICYIVLSFFLIKFDTVMAEEYYDNNNPGKVSTPSPGSAGEVTNWSNSNLDAVMIRIYNSSGTLKQVTVNGQRKNYAIFSLADTADNCYGNTTAKLCTTTGYNFSVMNQNANISGVSCYSSSTIQFSGCLTGTNLNNMWYRGTDAWVSNGEPLQTYFTKNNYTKLKNVLENIGYSASDGDYVIVEPMTTVRCNSTPYFGTVNALKANNIGYKPTANGKSNVCTDNVDDDWTFVNVYNSIANAFKYNRTSVCNSSPNTMYDNTNYSGCGFFRYDVSDMGYPKAKLYVTKKFVDSSDKAVTLTKKTLVTFLVYNSKSTCESNGQNINGTGFYIESGKSSMTVENPIIVEPGKTYWIKETGVVSGFKENNTCYQATVNSSGNRYDVTVTNVKEEQTCEQDISGSENDKNKRIEVYLKWEEKGKKYTNLLDFTIPNPTAQKLCSQASCSSTMTTACLSASNTSSIFQNFNSNDLSCYDQKLEINNGAYTAFCATAYNLSNSLNLTNNSFGTVRSGSIVINKSGNVLSSTFIKKCYIYGTNNANYAKYIDNLYSGFESIGGSKYNVEYISLNNKNLIKSTTSDTSTAATVLSSYNAIEKQWTRVVQYSLNPVYTEIASGNVDVCENSNLCKFLGYGFVSKLTDEGNKSVPFELKLNNTVYRNNICTYTATNSLIDDDLKLEFRSISKTNPFPSKDGGGRTVGSNWCEGENCTSSNNIVESVITNSNDSYNSTGKGAIYRIELDAATIKEIREYNKNRKYDEYDLECDENATNCKSKFLEQFNIIRLQN